MAKIVIPTSGKWSLIAGYLNNNTDELYTAKHEHSNKAVLDLTTEVFNTSRANKLDNLEANWKGTFETSADLISTYGSPLDGWGALVTGTATLWSAKDGVWSDTGIGSFGDMLRSQYDPQSIASDVFDRANHTGLIQVADVEGLQATLTALQDAVTTLTDSVATKMDWKVPSAAFDYDVAISADTDINPSNGSGDYALFENGITSVTTPYIGLQVNEAGWYMVTAKFLFGESGVIPDAGTACDLSIKVNDVRVVTNRTWHDGINGYQPMDVAIPVPLAADDVVTFHTTSAIFGSTGDHSHIGMTFISQRE